MGGVGRDEVEGGMVVVVVVVAGGGGCSVTPGPGWGVVWVRVGWVRVECGEWG